MNPGAKGHVMFGVTLTRSAEAFLPGQLRYLQEQGWETSLVVGEGDAQDFASEERLQALYSVPTSRNPSISDPLFMYRLVRLFLRTRPDVTILGTPKMGVFGTVAALIAGVPRRVYLVHGFRADGLGGVARRAMILLERVGCAAATDVVVVSRSLGSRLVEECRIRDSKIKVVGAGTANGVDIDRFANKTDRELPRLRSIYEIPSSSPVVCFVGRLTRDKGIVDLPRVWESVIRWVPDAHLIIAGAPEPVDDLDAAAINKMEQLPNVTLLGHVSRVEDVFAASDIHLMLSRREGMGMVALEAAASGVPTVALAVTGVVDAVDHESSGVLVHPGADSIAEVSRQIVRLLESPATRKALGDVGRLRVSECFDRNAVWLGWERLLADEDI